MNNFSPIELILTIFSIFAWSRAFIRFREKNINVKEFAFWTVVWVTAVVIVYLPGKTTTLARFLGMERGFDAFVFLGIVAIFYIVYRLYVKANENEQAITELIRKIALKEAEKRSIRSKKS